MEDIDELYRRVEICERLLQSVSAIPKEARSIQYEGEPFTYKHCNGGIIKFERVVFPYQNEALVSYKGVDYNLNYGLIHMDKNISQHKWINISKQDLSFLNKTIIPLTDFTDFERPIRYKYVDDDGYGSTRGTVQYDIFGDHLPRKIQTDLWIEMRSQLIPAPPEAVETITRETINEALFETRLQIHEIKKVPPYVIGNGNPLLTPRMNLFMPTESPPVTLRPLYSVGAGNPSLTPPVSPRQNHTRRPVPRFARRKTQNVKNNTPNVGLAPRKF